MPEHTVLVRKAASPSPPVKDTQSVNPSLRLGQDSVLRETKLTRFLPVPAMGDPALELVGCLPSAPALQYLGDRYTCVILGLNG